MQFFNSELGHEYSKTYTFGYCNYAAFEHGDGPRELEEIYAHGYLPYSGSPDAKGLFYMARSGRIHLPDWELNSECRRVAKKFDGIFTRESIPLEKFPVDPAFKRFWLDYFTRAHGAHVMPRERLDSILAFGIISHVGMYRDRSGKIGGYTLEVTTETMTHDWFHAWAPELDKSSFGMYALIDIGRAAKARSAKYYYCGTVYGNSMGANYKTNLSNLEYWNGSEWVQDLKHTKLKKQLKADASRRIALLDEWKENHPLF